MNINATLMGQNVVINLFIMLFLTLMFAKRKSGYLPLVALYTFLLSVLFIPASWLYCMYWAFKKPKEVGKQ